MAQMYMSRSPQGSLAKRWRSEGIIAIGYGSRSASLASCRSREDVEAEYLKSNPAANKRAVSDISQLSRFLLDLHQGVDVITYDPEARQYYIGTITGEYEYRPSNSPGHLPHTRFVNWKGSVSRDDLNPETKNTLGSLLTIYRLNDDAAADIRSLLAGQKYSHQPSPDASKRVAGMPAPDARSIKDIASEARELVKDMIHSLDWEEVQELVAGVLRAMGYKTRVSPPGTDRGRDVIASRDGLGLEPPRIVAQVKHRKDQTSAADIRSFMSVLDGSDRGLYVSSGGFTKDARYEADRSAPPIALLDLDELATVLVEHYDSADVETRELVPLVPIYWPA
jgi:restriction system protein